MPYGARDLTAAHEGPVLRIGPSDHTLSQDRTWRGRVRRWWVQRCRTWRPKPLSVPQMLRLQAARMDTVHYFVVLYPILRASLPYRWWYRLAGDPLTLLFRLPRDVMELMLNAMVSSPLTGHDVTQEDDDPFAELARLQRRALKTDSGSGLGISLAVAALSVRATYGDSWYYDPDRWPTSDGYVPFAVALIEHSGVQALEIRRRLEVADGFSLAHAKPHEKTKMHKLAYPQEVC